MGLATGALLAVIAWKTGHGPLRVWCSAMGAVGLLAGLAVGVRKRWRDGDVALYLDGCLGAREAVTTALEVGARSGDGDLNCAMVVRDAASALETADRKRARPRILEWRHILIPVAGGAIAVLAGMPVPAVVSSPTPPGVEKVQLASVEGLEKVAALGALGTPDDAQRERLRQLAERARRLQDKLREGMERREALSEIAKLRDDIAAERLSLGDAERRSGLEAAQGQLAREALMRDAAKALGDRDLTRFDEEMQQLATSREQHDRDAARKALEEAAEAAKKNGAPDVARSLEEQKRLFDERSKRGQALRELGEAFGDDLSPELKRDLEDLAREGKDRDARKLAERMADAIEKLSPEERKRLGQRLARNAEKGALAPSTREQMRELARKLATAEGQKQLEEELRRMANDPTDSEEAARERGLDGAERGLGETEQQLGGGAIPIPMAGGGGEVPRPGQGDRSGHGQGPSASSSGSGPAGPGTHHDTGQGDHKGGATPEVDNPGLRARAGGKLNPGAPMPGAVSGRTRGKPGETANIRGTGALGEVGQSEVGGVERSEVPEEYRKQVGRYFNP